MKKVFSLSFICLFFLSCSMLQVKRDKEFLLDCKKMFLVERSELINTNDIDKNKIKLVYIPLLNGIKVRIDLSLEQGKLITSSKDPYYPLWKDGIKSIKKDLDFYKSEIEKEKLNKKEIKDGNSYFLNGCENIFQCRGYNKGFSYCT